MKIKQSQTWLFAFTDLAFLLLISLSLIPSAPNITMHFSEMDIPSVPNNPNMSPLSKDAHTWELQVYRKSEKHPKPFRLVRIGMQRNSGKDLRSGYLDRDTLIPKLRELKKSSVCPILMPEKLSLSQDFLFAAGAIAKVWRNEKGRSNQTVVRPLNPEERHSK